MSSIRVVRKLPEGISSIPPNAVSWGDTERYVDWIQSGTADDIPTDAVYACLLDDEGVYTEVVLAPAGFVFHHNFSGWPLPV